MTDDMRKLGASLHTKLLEMHKNPSDEKTQLAVISIVAELVAGTLVAVQQMAQDMQRIADRLEKR